MKTIRKKILTLAMILASVNASGRQAHFMMSAFGQGGYRQIREWEVYALHRLYHFPTYEDT